MAQTISPFIRSPFTDITGGLVSHQLLDRCAKQEMAFMDCLEAYGLDRGLKKCQALFEDFHECQTYCKQLKRFTAMRRERDRQIACGKLCNDNKYVSPRIDSY
ncbi:NADH dehydrogenase [ubiquinone] iron-sulfur protein 5 [Amyelois transitella]|uniref:NADH dehydrogenase [ubiquinone] iron-sulfur protein 5 n=1 Tax=Amyelois transitella TaxID=680683 RepID=UPI00067CA1FD|nr:NADH dehydrogenase [ubiquinone] iron-sulfur protein 5 [Amyelois transitella]